MGSGRWWEGCGRHRRIAVAIGRSYTGWKHLCSPFAVTRSPVKQSPLEKKKPPSQTSQNPRLSSLHRNQKDEILFPSLGSSREQVSQNRSRSPGKRWSGAVNPSNRRRENCTFLHVLQVLVPSVSSTSGLLPRIGPAAAKLKHRLRQKVGGEEKNLAPSRSSHTGHQM
nr:uncharacterized protein LOC102098211 isoform X8 [Columba livia]